MTNSFHSGMSVLEARRVLHLLAEDGTTCPVCDQHAQIYRRALYSTMTRDLIQCYRRYGSLHWFDITTVTGKRGSGDVTKMRYWGLLEREMDSVGPDGNPRTGIWRVTTRGAWWLRKRILVPKYAVIYDNELLRLEGQQWSVEDALGKNFNYRELMAGV